MLAVDWGMKIFAFLLVLLIGMWVAKIVKRGLVTVMEKKGVDPVLVGFLSSLIYVGLQAFVIIAALEKLNVKTTSFIAIVGAAGLAIGLALQGSLANFASGVLMIIFKPFTLGDFIEAGGSGVGFRPGSQCAAHRRLALARIVLVPALFRRPVA
jgi:small conductance mechanosensitive channel